MARCFCPKHGKLDFDDVLIDEGQPVCKKCKSPLEFGKVRPRRLEKRAKPAKGMMVKKAKKRTSSSRSRKK